MGVNLMIQRTDKEAICLRKHCSSCPCSEWCQMRRPQVGSAAGMSAVDEAIQRSIDRRRERRIERGRKVDTAVNVGFLLLITGMVYGSIWLIGDWAQGR